MFDVNGKSYRSRRSELVSSHEHARRSVALIMPNVCYVDVQISPSSKPIPELFKPIARNDFIGSINLFFSVKLLLSPQYIDLV